MPHHARLDTPGTLHPVIIRGIEKRQSVNDDEDRRRFVARLGDLATALQTAMYAWALWSTHAHLFVRSGPEGLPPFMRRLLTGSAPAYNRRHRRHGHLLQNRYKSMVCEEEGDFTELVRYIHLNPLRAKLVTTLAELDRYTWSGHAMLMGRKDHPWQEWQAGLTRFGKNRAAARHVYHQYLEEGSTQGRKPALGGGGRLRSRGGWAEVVARRKHHDKAVTEERVLGSGEFVERLLQEADKQMRERGVARRRPQGVVTYVEQTCANAGGSAQALGNGGRGREVSQLRTLLAHQLVKEQGLSLAEAARHLGVTTSAICTAVQKEAR